MIGGDFNLSTRYAVVDGTTLREKVSEPLPVVVKRV